MEGVAFLNFVCVPHPTIYIAHSNVLIINQWMVMIGYLNSYIKVGAYDGFPCHFCFDNDSAAVPMGNHMFGILLLGHRSPKPYFSLKNRNPSS